MLKHPRRQNVLRIELSLAFFDAQNSPNGVLKPYTFEQLSKERASEPTRMAFTRAASSVVLTSQNFDKFKMSSVLHSRLARQHLGVTAVIESLVRHSKTFNSRYDNFCQAARTADVAKNFVSFCFAKSAI